MVGNRPEMNIVYNFNIILYFIWGSDPSIFRKSCYKLHYIIPIVCLLNQSKKRLCLILSIKNQFLKYHQTQISFTLETINRFNNIVQLGMYMTLHLIQYFISHKLINTIVQISLHKYNEMIKNFSLFLRIGY